MRHYLVLGIIVMVCASITALVVHALLTSSGWINSQASVLLDNTTETRSVKITPSIAIALPKDSTGQYILPTTDPLNPLALGPETVGGATACERLFNLKQCLIRNNSTLEARLATPVASASAGLNDACGLILNEASDIRPASFELGCIW